MDEMALGGFIGVLFGAFIGFISGIIQYDVTKSGVYKDLVNSTNKEYIEMGIKKYNPTTGELEYTPLYNKLKEDKQ